MSTNFQEYLSELIKIKEEMNTLDIEISSLESSKQTLNQEYDRIKDILMKAVNPFMFSKFDLSQPTLKIYNNKTNEILYEGKIKKYTLK